MYETLKERVCKAKMQKKFCELKENEKIIINHIYNQIIYGVETQRFRFPRNYTLSARLKQARVDLFQISFKGNSICICTIFRLSTHIYTFKYKKQEIDNVKKIILSAVEEVGLKVEDSKKHYYLELNVYYLASTKEIKS